MKVKKITKERITATIDKDMASYLKKLSKDLKSPFSYVLNIFLRAGFEKFLKEKKGWSKKMEIKKITKEKITATIDEDMALYLKKLSKDLKSPFSYILNIFLRDGFEKFLKEKKEEVINNEMYL